jgi:phosphocarrier protein HPr
MSCSRDVAFKDRDDLHIRPAQRIAQVASGFTSDITVLKDGLKLNAKSILDMIDLMAHTANSNDLSIRIAANGEDEQAAVESLCRLVEERFGLEADA